MPGAEPKHHQIFLSYSRSDQQAAIAMRTALEKQGLTVFHDIQAIHAGDNWMNALQNTLRDCSGFVLLAGRDGVQRWINAEVQVALSRHLSPHDDAECLPIYPVLLEGANYDVLPPFLQLFQLTPWSPDEAVPQALLDAVASGVSTYDYDKKPFEGCPFLGLNAFQREHAQLFFGRRLETLQALACLGDQQQTNPDRIQSTTNTVYYRWLQVEGNSGSGKSSLVNAGMLSMIEQGALWPRTGYEKWRIFEPMMPGRNPLEMLADTLAHKQKGLIEANRSLLAWTKELEADERALAYALREYRQNDTAFLLIIDQFEELFTFAEEQPRKQFDALLATALQDPQCPLFVITTVRADFLDRFEMLTKLQGIYNDHCKRYFLPQISEQGLREIIQQPAKLAGLDVSDVSEMVIRDAVGEIGALPLVENGLHYLWEQRQGNKLSVQLYTGKGGLAGLLSTQADQLLNQLGADKKYALKLLLRLTRINNEGHHTRRRITREEAIHVAGKGERGEKVIQLLSGQRALDGRNQQGALRLITVSEPRHDNNGNGATANTSHNVKQQDDTQRYVDLIHETLVRSRGEDEKTGKPVGYWPTLYNYIDDNRDNDMHLQQLQYQSKCWQQSSLLGKWAILATRRERKEYKKLDIDKSSMEGRFLFWSRWVGRLQILILTFVLCVLGVIGDALWWANEKNLPFGYAFLKPLWHLGYFPEPEMVEIPAGSFHMGCVSGKSCEKQELPVHEVNFSEPFFMGKYEVTFLQYDRYIWEKQNTGEDVQYPSDQGWGRYDRPVVEVSWYDAQAYIRWLNKKTGKDYRLPSEAEWEYAARAGTETRFSTGDCITGKQANFHVSYMLDKGCGLIGKGLGKTSSIGSYPANAYELHDMHGNVWEWVEDGYNESYKKAPRDGSSWLGTGRVLRGGAWNFNEEPLRSANRGTSSPDYHANTIGFRLSRGGSHGSSGWEPIVIFPDEAGM